MTWSAMRAAVALVIVASGPALADAPGGKIVRLVGWWINPTPNNAWLRTAGIEYIVSEQGQGGADGDWPDFAKGRFVATNGGYGYGCASLSAVIAGKRVVRIERAMSLPLERCRRSPALRKAEPSRK